MPSWKDHPGIPRSELQMGIKHCLCVASLRLEESDTLLEKGLPTSAGIIFSFAVEEYGKAVLLRRAYEAGADPAPIAGFYDHGTKLAAAASSIPAEHLRLIETAYGSATYGTGAYGGKTVDLEDRLGGLYVDWRDGQWTHGLPVNPGVLAQSSRGLQSHIQAAIIDWT
jgi:hypothetical protein